MNLFRAAQSPLFVLAIVTAPSLARADDLASSTEPRFVVPLASDATDDEAPHTREATKEPAPAAQNVGQAWRGPVAFGVGVASMSVGTTLSAVFLGLAVEAESKPERCLDFREASMATLALGTAVPPLCNDDHFAEELGWSLGSAGAFAAGLGVGIPLVIYGTRPALMPSHVAVGPGTVRVSWAF